MHAYSIGESSRSEQHSSKRRKVETETYDLLSDFKTAATQLSTADSDDTRHELDKHPSLPVTETDALQFWKQNESAQKLPKLASVAKLARKLLAIPATIVLLVKGYFHCVD